MSRIDKLLKKGAEDLDNGCSFPNEQYFEEQDPTAEEIFAVTSKAAQIIKGFLLLPEEYQNAVIVLGAGDGAITWEAVQYAINQQKLRKTAKAIKDFKIK